MRPLKMSLRRRGVRLPLEFWKPWRQEMESDLSQDEVEHEEPKGAVKRM